MAQPHILKPYERRGEPGLFQRIALGFGLVVLAVFYGLMCLVLPMQMLVIPAVPILLGIGMILWLLPDAGGVKEEWIGSALLAYVAFNALWPSYMAVNLSGLPWISPTRIALFSLLAAAILNFATSAELRTKINEAVWTLPWLARAFWLFWATTVVALVISVDPMSSLTKFANNQIYWTLMFGFSCWLASREGYADRFGKIIAWTIIPVALVAINEYRVGSVVWIPYLPGWLQSDPEIIAKVASFNGRAFTNEYRARGTFGGSLYFAEYLALAFPFVLHLWSQSKKLYQSVLMMMAVVAVATTMVFTGSRSAALAVLLSPILLIFLTAWRTRQIESRSLVASAALFSYPALAGVMATLVIFWRRLHVMIIGGGQHQGSTDARDIQWAMGWPKIFARPLGHGAATSGGVLGFYNGGSEMPTVDSYFLTLLLEYGFVGLFAFIAMLFLAMWYGWQGYNRTRRTDMLVLAPLIVALFNFTIIKAVSSTEGSLPIVFIMMGCIVGIMAQQQRADRLQGDGPPPP
ncbi:MAG: O-antigen ligase family protein [Sandarakinorhabdus sp.]|nr:O-antigen ligase family protein [Sandarakinorhabdus sp.]